jgi:hypothetical protein
VVIAVLVQCVAALPDPLPVHPVTYKHNEMIHRLEGEADEMASLAQKKANKQWIWIAMEATTRQVMAVHVGERSRGSAKRLWAKIPDLSLPSDESCGVERALHEVHYPNFYPKVRGGRLGNRVVP